ncbi:MAG: hypothetical protein LBI04_08595 [Treponema sp.]|jgi:hypothetical protein|nr:hypothetical protein [Treponema sp.]
MKDMKKTGMESFVRCPKCKELVKISFSPIGDELQAFAPEMRGTFGMLLDESNRFYADGKCKCGRYIFVRMTVMALPEVEK